MMRPLKVDDWKFDYSSPFGWEPHRLSETEDGGG
jgi:hypothetical protein